MAPDLILWVSNAFDQIQDQPAHTLCPVTGLLWTLFHSLVPWEVPIHRLDNICTLCCPQGDLANGSLPIDLLYERSIKEKIEEDNIDDFGSISKLLLYKGLALPSK